MCIFIFRKVGDLLIPHSKTQVWLCVSSGFIGVFLAQLTFCLGLELSHASYTAPWMLLCPLFTTSIGIYFKYEKSDHLKYKGLGISFLSTMGLIILELVYTQITLKTFWGTLMLLISSLCTASAFFLWQKLVVKEEIPVLIVSFWTLASGSIFMLISYCLKPFWYFWNTSPGLISSISGLATIISCLFIVTLGYSITFAIMIWATQKSVISTVALYPSARPIFTIFLSILISKESWIEIFLTLILIVLVLSGLLLAAFSKDVERRNKKDDKREAKKAQLKSALSPEAIEIIKSSSSNYYKLN